MEDRNRYRPEAANNGDFATAYSSFQSTAYGSRCSTYPNIVQAPTRIIDPSPSPVPNQTSQRVTLTIFFVLVLGYFLLASIDSSYTAPNVQVESIRFSPFNVSGNSPAITAKWDLSFLIRNPNRVTKFYYEKMIVSVYYNTELLTGTFTQRFYQHPKNQTLKDVSSAIIEKRFDDWVLKNMAEDLKRGYVDFNVTMQGWAELYFKFWFPTSIWISATCSDIRVGFATNATSTITPRTMLGGSRSCNVRLNFHPDHD